MRQKITEIALQKKKKIQHDLHKRGKDKQQLKAKE